MPCPITTFHVYHATCHPTLVYRDFTVSLTFNPLITNVPDTYGPDMTFNYGLYHNFRSKVLSGLCSRMFLQTRFGFFIMIQIRVLDPYFISEFC